MLKPSRDSDKPGFLAHVLPSKTVPMLSKFSVRIISLFRLMTGQQPDQAELSDVLDIVMVLS